MEEIKSFSSSAELERESGLREGSSCHDGGQQSPVDKGLSARRDIGLTSASQKI